MGNILYLDAREGSKKNAALCQEYMTPGLIEKLERITVSCGANAIIRAQDLNETAIRTLNVNDLGGNWYMVSYYWRQNDPKTLTEIPLKAEDIGGRCVITYMTPYWHKSRYGDDLLPRAQDLSEKIDQSSEQAFVQSFYDVYLSKYCAMSVGLEEELAVLREKYLTRHALKVFEQARMCLTEYDEPVYDFLIDGIDFDFVWKKAFKINSWQEHIYNISYNKHFFYIIATQENGIYKIDGIVR